MTKPTGAVNAVMDMIKILIVNKQSPRSKKPLLHGLPEEFLDQALHWKPAPKDGVCLRSRQIEQQNGQKKNIRFPTWSWAAWEAAKEINPVSRQPVDRPGGVQYEATYRVQTDNRGWLQKVLHKNEDEERRMDAPSAAMVHLQPRKHDNRSSASANSEERQLHAHQTDQPLPPAQRERPWPDSQPTHFP